MSVCRTATPGMTKMCPIVSDIDHASEFLREARSVLTAMSNAARARDVSCSRSTRFTASCGWRAIQDSIRSRRCLKSVESRTFCSRNAHPSAFCFSLPLHGPQESTRLRRGRASSGSRGAELQPRAGRPRARRRASRLGRQAAEGLSKRCYMPFEPRDAGFEFTRLLTDG